jgi:hypothetical protein
MPRQAIHYRQTRLGQVLQEALDRKSEYLSKLHGRPVRYTYRDVQDDAHIAFGTISTWILGKNQPGRETLAAVIHALDGFVDPNEVWFAAGYTPPETTRIHRLLRRAMRLPEERVESMLALIETQLFGRPLTTLPEDAPELYHWPDKPLRKRKSRAQPIKPEEDAKGNQNGQASDITEGDGEKFQRIRHQESDDKGDQESR